jgi:ADP-ribosylglycohydrolase
MARAFQAEVRSHHSRRLFSAEERLYSVMLGGAIGDAVGGAIGVMSRWAMDRHFGVPRLEQLRQGQAKVGPVSGLTRMMLFTVEGVACSELLARAGENDRLMPSLDAAYRRSLPNPGQANVDLRHQGWLADYLHLLEFRDYDHETRLALQTKIGRPPGEPAINLYNSVNGVARAGPLGVMFDEAFELGAMSARLTQGHPDGVAAAGWFAEWIGALADGERKSAFDKSYDPATSISAMGNSAEEFAVQKRPIPDVAPASLGLGYAPQEVAMIAYWAMCTATSPLDALARALYVSGPSEGVGCLVGQALGARFGSEWMPREWVEQLEVRQGIERLARQTAQIMWSGMSLKEKLQLNWSRYPVTTGSLQ